MSKPYVLALLGGGTPRIFPQAIVSTNFLLPQENKNIRKYRIDTGSRALYYSQAKFTEKLSITVGVQVEKPCS
jgi:hypothetical protein